MCSLPKSLVTELQCKQQLRKHMLYESLIGQYEYKTEPKGSFWCHFIDTKGEVLLAILLNKFVLVFSITFRYRVELKLLQNLKSEVAWA